MEWYDRYLGHDRAIRDVEWKRLLAAVKWRARVVHQFELRTDILGQALDRQQRRSDDHCGTGFGGGLSGDRRLSIHLRLDQHLAIFQPDLRLFRDACPA